jgi:hypothetical protein
MANELQLLPNPTNIPTTIQNSYQRQNTNLLCLQLGLDTTAPKIINGNTISIPAGGLIESNGFLFKLVNDFNIAISDVNNDYFIAVSDNGDGTADLNLTTVYPTYIPSQNGWYTSSNERVLNNFYMRKIFVKRNENGENIGPITFIDLNGTGSIDLVFPYGSKYRFNDDTSEKTTIGPVNKTRPNKGYVRFNSSVSTI